MRAFFMTAMLAGTALADEGVWNVGFLNSYPESCRSGYANIPAFETPTRRVKNRVLYNNRTAASLS